MNSDLHIMNSDDDICGLKQEKYGNNIFNCVAACEVGDKCDLIRLVRNM